MTAAPPATPRPWVQGEIEPAAILVNGNVRLRINSTGNQADEEADAALIVRAVNAHDDLVAALKALVDWAEDGPVAAGSCRWCMAFSPRPHAEGCLVGEARALLAAYDAERQGEGA